MLQWHNRPARSALLTPCRCPARLCCADHQGQPGRRLPHACRQPGFHLHERHHLRCHLHLEAPSAPPGCWVHPRVCGGGGCWGVGLCNAAGQATVERGWDCACTAYGVAPIQSKQAHTYEHMGLTAAPCPLPIIRTTTGRPPVRSPWWRRMARRTSRRRVSGMGGETQGGACVLHMCGVAVGLFGDAGCRASPTGCRQLPPTPPGACDQAVRCPTARPQPLLTCTVLVPSSCKFFLTPRLAHTRSLQWRRPPLR